MSISHPFFQAGTINPMAPTTDEEAFKRNKTVLIARALILSTIVIGIVDTLIMVFLEFVLKLPDPEALVLDGLILVIILFPLNYWFIIRPMSHLVDEHHRANLQLIQSSEILDRFFSISEISIAYMDSDFYFIRVNSAYAHADEHEPEYYVGKNHFDLFPHPENQQIFEMVVQTGKAYYITEKPFDYAGHPERGTTYWDWSLLPVKNPNRQVSGVLLILNDVTARKKAELALEENERRFRAVFNQTFQHIGLLDPSGKILVANQTTLDFTGMQASDLIGKPLWEAGWWDPPDDAINRLEIAVKHARAGKVVHREILVRSGDGKVAFMDITLKPLLDEAGKTSLLIYEARDETGLIQTLEALRQGEEEIKRLYQAEKHAHQLAETLRTAGLELSGSLDSSTVLETLLDHLHKMVPYTSAHVLRFDDETHLLVSLARGEETWEEADRQLGRRYDVDEHPALRSFLKDRKTLSVPDVALYPESLFSTIQGYARSWLGIPLLASDQVIGLCGLEHTDPGFFTQEHLHWASALVGQAAVAIQNAWLFEQVRDNRERLQALSRRLVEVQEMERHYIAQELHDEAGQALASLMVGLRMIERDAGDEQAVLDQSRELKAIADSVLENLHRLSIDLRPATLDHLGLVAALRQHAQRISDQHGLIVQFETVGQIERLPAEMETAIYRIVQEALTNVIRHAHATRVDILLDRRGECLVVIVEDNGAGFDPHTPKEGQLGMLGMRERADMLGGRLTVESSPGQGSTIFLEVPWPSES
jgi:PAS domain S-box-containing protein